MKWIWRIFVLVLLLTGWGLATACLHVIRTPDKVILLPKDRLGLSETWVDTTGWTPGDLPEHRDLVLRLIHVGKADRFTQFLDPKSKLDAETQLSHLIDPPKTPVPPPHRAPSTVGTPTRPRQITPGTPGAK